MTNKNSELRSVYSVCDNQLIHTMAHTDTHVNPHEGHLRDKAPTRDHRQTAHTHHYTRGQDTQDTHEDTIA